MAVFAYVVVEIGSAGRRELAAIQPQKCEVGRSEMEVEVRYGIGEVQSWHYFVG